MITSFSFRSRLCKLIYFNVLVMVMPITCSSPCLSNHCFDLKPPSMIGWNDNIFIRACSCSPFCHFYGDCCSDALQKSKFHVSEHLKMDITLARQQFGTRCQQFETGSIENDMEMIYVQTADKCENCDFGVGLLTEYHGSDIAEVNRRMPMYHEKLGMVFESYHCSKCYDNITDMDMLKPLPIVAHCNATVNFSLSGIANATDSTWCQYAINISAIEDTKTPRLAICVPIVEDEIMNEEFACFQTSKETTKFSPCTKDDAITGLERDDYGSIYKICSKTQSAGCNRTEEENRCVTVGDVYHSPMVMPLGIADSFIKRVHRSDFSFRYMFDFEVLEEAQEVVEGRGGSCKGKQEIYIELWRICVIRSGEIDFQFAVSKAQSSKAPPHMGNSDEDEWLEFTDSIAQLEQNSTGVVIKLAGEKAEQLILESYCFQWMKPRFFVSAECLCEIFREIYTPEDLHSIVPRHDYLLSMVGSISIWISLICLALTVVVLVATPSLRNRPKNIVIVMSSFLMLGMVMILINTYLDPSVIRPRHQQRATYEEQCFASSQWQVLGCNLVGAILHFSYLATFCLASSLYIDLWNSVRTSLLPAPQGTYYTADRRLLVLIGVSCAIPLSIVTISLVLDYTFPDANLAPRYAEYTCWISEPHALLVFFVFPVVGALLVDIIFFFLIARQIRENTFRLKDKTPSVKLLDEQGKKKRSEEKRKKHLRRLGIYGRMAIIMGLTWLLGCVASMIPDEGNVFPMILWYMFVITNGLQGVFIFYTYILNKKTLKVLRDRWCNIQPSRHLSTNTQSSNLSQLNKRKQSADELGQNGNFIMSSSHNCNNVQTN